MTGLTLVTGPHGSGKTERLVELAAERYATDPFARVLVLTPTVRHADQFRRRLVERAGVTLGLDIVTLSQFAARDLGGAHAPAVEVAQELLARVIRDTAEGEGAAARLRPLAASRGLHDLVRQAIGDLVVDGIDSVRFASAAAATTNRDLRALATVFTAYREALDARGWVDPGDRARLAAEQIARGGGESLPSLVLVDGVQFLRGGEVALVCALARHTGAWIAIDPDAGERSRWTREALSADFAGEVREEPLEARDAGTSLTAFTTAGAEEEVREIARTIKQRLANDASLRPSDCAMVYRQASPHLAMARRIFAEYHLPLDAAAGEPLPRRPFGAWLVRLLRLGLHGWRPVDVLGVLGGGFAAWRAFGFGPGDAERLRRVAREHALWSGEAAMHALGDAATAAGSAGAEAWQAAVARLLPLLDPEATRTPAEHAALLDGALFGANGIVRAEVERYPSLATEVEAMRAVLRGERAIDEALGAPSVGFVAFVDRLVARMEATPVSIREAGGVLLAPMHTVHGLQFRDVHVGGLVEGEFPARRSGVAFLDREAREALAEAGLALPPEPRASEDELWQSAVTRADGRTGAWRPRRDAGGRVAAASFYFDRATDVAGAVTEIAGAIEAERTASDRELALRLTAAWPVETRKPHRLPAWGPLVRHAAPIEQQRRSFTSAGEYEGEIPGADLHRLVQPEQAWSASRLESYRTCPFQFFAHYSLRLSELDEERPEADAALRGSVIHEILDNAVRPLAETGQPLDSSTVGIAIARLHDEGARLWQSAPGRHQFGRVALWRYEQRFMLERLEAMLRREAEVNERIGVERVIGGEHQSVQALAGVDPPLLVDARIDRVDALRGGGIQIVDYKSGRPTSRAEVMDGRRVQLPVYAAVMAAESGAERLVARYAFLRASSEPWWLDTGDGEQRQVVDDVIPLAAKVRDDVSRGRFPVAPPSPDCPRYCAYQTACRVNQFSRSKQWS